MSWLVTQASPIRLMMWMSSLSTYLQLATSWSTAASREDEIVDMLVTIYPGLEMDPIPTACITNPSSVNKELNDTPSGRLLEAMSTNHNPTFSYSSAISILFTTATNTPTHMLSLSTISLNLSLAMPTLSSTNSTQWSDWAKL
jgi:hypothetical protein